MIHRAARDGKLWLLKHLLDCYPHLLEQRNGKGETPLLVAVKHAFVAGVHYLVSQGASLDVASEAQAVSQKTALHWACQPGWYQVAAVLIRGGARDTPYNGEYVFHRLILDNQLKLVQALYERQPELLYVRDRYTQLPIALANDNNCFEIAAFLHAKMGENDNTFDIMPAPSVPQEDLKISADNVNVRDAGGMTPLMRAVCAGNVGKVSTLLVTHTIALDMAVEQPDTDKHGRTALQLAYKKQCIIIVSMLLDAGAKVCPELRTTDFWWLAANMAEIKTVERLLDTYTVRGDERERCLNSLIQREVFKTEGNRMCIAAKHGYNHVLQYLIAQQESVNTPLDAPGKTSHGKKPLDFALEAGHDRTVSILKAAGATPSPEKQPCITVLSMFATCNESGLDVSDEAMAESAFGQGSYTAQCIAIR
ncbi:MAG: ankyrin repeat domain-containing protein [Legionellaceae bacterium]|nr:ankyrin repeat domain-containing protein [Legionellaceae bacterium]